MLITIYLKIKSAKIKNPTPSLKNNLDTFLIIVFRKKNKSGKFGPQKVKESIRLMLIDEFFDCLNCMEEDAVWLLFRINNFIGKRKRD